MSEAATLLVEVRSCGGLVYRIGDRVRVQPASAIAENLLQHLRSQKRQLLDELPDGHIDGDWLGIRIHSRVFDADVWLAADDDSAKTSEREVKAEGESTLVFTLAEVLTMEGMLAAEMQAIARIKRTLAGAGLEGRLDKVTARREGFA